jgi:hypothetical protein
VRLVSEASGLMWMVCKVSAANRQLAAAAASATATTAPEQRAREGNQLTAAARAARTAALAKAITYVCNFSTYSDISKVGVAACAGGRS